MFARYTIAAVVVGVTFAALRAVRHRLAEMQRAVTLLGDQFHKQQLALAQLERAAQEQPVPHAVAPPPSDSTATEALNWRLAEIAAATAAAEAAATAYTTSTAMPTPEGLPKSAAFASGSLLSELPHETVLRIFELLPPAGLLNAERVCHGWRHAAASVPFWPHWRTTRAELGETSLSIPGVLAYAFGAPPSEVPEEARAASKSASAQARELSAASLELAPCGSAWTVLRMGGGEGFKPAALKQHQARDYVLATCASCGLVFSGDKEASLRVWGARSGELLARVALPGGSMCALAASHGHVFVADSQGVVHMLSTAALLRSDVESVSWRAHDGKAAALHCRPYDGVLLSGGADGWVRKWACDRIGQQAASQRRSASHGAGGAARVDVGLWAVGSAALALSRHVDTVTTLARDDEYACSGSREGTVHVSCLSDGTLHFSIPAAGLVNCMAAHRGRLVLCADDGQQATLGVWDLARSHLVQEVSGIRKWNAPTAFAYLGFGRCFWIREATLCTMTWR